MLRLMALFITLTGHAMMFRAPPLLSGWQPAPLWKLVCCIRMVPARMCDSFYVHSYYCVLYPVVADFEAINTHLV